jgi:hypothetical protein
MGSAIFRTHFKSKCVAGYVLVTLIIITFLAGPQDAQVYLIPFQFYKETLGEKFICFESYFKVFS